MNNPKSKQSLINLGHALKRLKEALQEPMRSSLVIDGTIQRFEFVVELYWKTFKRLLAEEGIQSTTPREALQKAYEAHWIDQETAWLQMLKDKNETSHVYDEESAKRIYDHIREYYPELERTYDFLLRKFAQKKLNFPTMIGGIFIGAPKLNKPV